MIDKMDGTLIFDGGNKIGKNLPKTVFLGMNISKNFQILFENQPWITYCSNDLRINDIPISIGLVFNDEQLKKIEFSIRDPKYGTSWKDYSIDKEMDRKKRHDKWLEARLGEQREFPWGNVLSVFDGKMGLSQIIIDYT